MASNGIEELERVLSSGVLCCVPLYIGFSAACHVRLQGRKCCGIQLQNMGTFCVQSVVFWVYVPCGRCVFQSFRGIYCLHPHDDSLQDVDAEMVGGRVFVGYTGKLEEVWSVRGRNEPMGVSSKNGSWTDVSGEI